MKEDSYLQHYFVLTDTKLSYMEAQDDEPEHVDEAQNEEDKVRDVRVLSRRFHP